MRSFLRGLSLVAVFALVAGTPLFSDAAPRTTKSARPYVSSTRPVDPRIIPQRVWDAAASHAAVGSRSGGFRRSFRSLSPSTTFGFDAIPRIGPNWPADPTGAVGDSWFVTAVNTSYAVYDPSGVAVLGPAPLKALFTFPSRTLVFDPKVVYDHYNDAFVLVYLAVNDFRRRSWIMVVSIPNATATDTSTWCGRRIGADRTVDDGRQWADYPGLGFDLTRVVVTTNQFDFEGLQAFRGAQILSFPKTTLYDCTVELTFDTITPRQTKTPEGFRAFTIQPAVTVGAAPTAQHLLSFEKTGRSSSALTLWQLQESSGVLAMSKASLEAGRVQYPFPGTQAGGSLTNINTYWDAGDLRLVNAFYDADTGKIYAAHAVFKDLQPDTVTGQYEETVVRWYEVQVGSPLSSSSLARSGYIGTPETDAGWPVVATDGSGNLFVAYSRASSVTGEYLSAWAAEIVPGSTDATTMLLAAGDARLEAIRGMERWGDYNGISRDPVDPSRIVMVNQYAVSDGLGPTADWQQTVDVVTHV